ncbi:SipW-dependent-type signal peptide-containing protein [Ohessyouella blattaphilus]|uniref:SipW-dependent-type signal peptide-containing protein n=1 Tax=Ohessyouella blattaphilus TaxID=2949333 RepID=A0ABT1EKZ8_9FIRM|nr:SipW-dependent-type signal peptide-containing protein [Ohessyouella blattaphilus]MCP1111201.1 SipW-dependent-type signal peptide-containing protein [Ohessyouella blattaphilus]MCR8564595.1 SipW-dependent-type signal peptide-containing protein [Ohessyouella blattaphilus]
MVKNKKKISVIVAIFLIAVIGIGATLAYLSDTANTVTNAFTVGDVEAETWEKVPGGEDGLVDNEEGFTYEDMVPGVAMDKAPYVKVLADSVDAYVYANVTGLNGVIQIMYGENEGFNTDDWTAVDVDEFGNGLYRYNDIVESNAADVSTTCVFDFVKLNRGIENGDDGLTLDGESVTADDLIIQGFVIQAAGLTIDEADDAALAAF